VRIQKGLEKYFHKEVGNSSVQLVMSVHITGNDLLMIEGLKQSKRSPAFKTGNAQ
jgi:hypothetical protein